MCTAKTIEVAHFVDIVEQTSVPANCYPKVYKMNYTSNLIYMQLLEMHTNNLYRVAQNGFAAAVNGICNRKISMTKKILVLPNFLEWPGT